MTEEEINKIVDMIVEGLFERMDMEAKAMNEEFINSLPNDEDQIVELNMLLKHYEGLEDYIQAASVFAKIKQLKELK